MLKVSTLLMLIPQRDPAEETTQGYTFHNKIISTQNIVNFEVINSWDEQIQTAKITISRKNNGWFIINNFDINKLNDKDYLNVYDYRNKIAESAVAQQLNKSNENINKVLFGYDNFNLTGFSDNVIGKYDVNSKIYPITPVIKVGDIVTFLAYYKSNGANSLNKDGKVYLKENIKLDGVDRSFRRKPFKATTYIEEYYLDANNLEEKQLSPRSQLFFGYVTSVNTETNGNIVIKCSDYMYYINQLQIKNTTYDPSKFTIEEMFEDLYNDAIERNKNLTNSKNTFYVNDRIKVNPLFNGKVRLIKKDDERDKNMRAGFIETKMNPTMGMFLKEIKNKYKCQPFFYPSSNLLNILPYRITTTPYGTGDYPEFGYQEHTFCFQENIVSHNLEFRRKQDKIIGARVKAFLTSTEEYITNYGENKTRKKPYTIILDPGGDIIDIPFLPNRDLRKLLNKKDGKKLLTESMIDYGKRALQKINYDGYYGSFITFGYPYVRHGDRILLKDNIYPERDGVYTVKSVRYFGGVNDGLRQEIKLDYRIGNTFTDIDKKLL